ncbi:MAG TPA: alpha-amylase family glycosyl hydrolase [Halomicronema sp.]
MSNAIEFKLFAPNNKAASLMGCFSDWQEIPMNKGEDGFFQVVVELKDGVYGYKFRIQTQSTNFQPDEWLEVNDPYATEIDPNTETSVLRLKEGQKFLDNYVWKYEDKVLPQNHELIIYEMQIPDFCGDEAENEDKFLYLIKKLEYLMDLGVNAIELMPIYEAPEQYYWGYKVRYFFALRNGYGSSENLKMFIDECHNRGIRVFLDGIYNHCEEECPLLLIDRNYWYYEYMHYPDDPANYWGPEFNYDNFDEKLQIYPAWKFMGDVVRFWIKEFHFDGIRYDAVRQLANRKFLGWLGEEAKKVAGNKPFYNMAEYIPEVVDIVGKDGAFEGCWRESFRIYGLENIAGDTFNLEKLKGILNAKIHGYPGCTSVINYLASHDRDHLMAEEAFRTVDKMEAFKRAKLGAVLLMTAMGVPMLLMGEEFGEVTRHLPNQENKLNWHLLNYESHRNLFEWYQRLIALRKSEPALQSNNIEFFCEDEEAKVVGYLRWCGENSRVAVVANFSDKVLRRYEVFLTGNWRDLLTGKEIKSQGNKVILDLEPLEGLVLVGLP